MPRALHFVGSLPSEIAPDEEAAMRWILSHTGPQQLTALPCDADPIWIIDYLNSLQNVTTDHGTPVFETAEPGEYHSYDTMRVYRLAHDPYRRGHVLLKPEHVSMHRVAKTRSVIELFRKIRAENPALAQLPYQISLPNPLDLALFVFVGPPFSPTKRSPRLWQALRRLPRLLTALNLLPVFSDATRREVTELCATDSTDIVFQFESPAVLLALDLTPSFLRPRVAALLARQVAELFASLPPAAKLIVHLCYGGLGKKSLIAPKNTSSHVLFLNALATQLRQLARPLPDVHLPIAHGDRAPSTDPAFYAPLNQLDKGYRLIAGVAAEHFPEDSDTALRLFEQATGAPALAVAAACGLGRHTADDAEKAVQLMSVLANTSHAAPAGTDFTDND